MKSVIINVWNDAVQGWCYYWYEPKSSHEHKGTGLAGLVEAVQAAYESIRAREVPADGR